MKKIQFIAASVLALLVTANANAVPVTGDFREELSLPGLVGPDVRVFENLGVAIAGSPDLTDANQIANPGGFGGHADVDLDTSGLITLTGREPQGFADYQLAVFKISGLVFSAGEAIIGVTAINGTGINDGQAGYVSPAPLIAFTADSVTISYATTGSDAFNFGAGQTSTFQLQLRNAQVPEPATAALLALGLLGLVARRRTSTKA